MYYTMNRPEKIAHKYRQITSALTARLSKNDERERSPVRASRAAFPRVKSKAVVRQAFDFLPAGFTSAEQFISERSKNLFFDKH